VLPPVSIAVGQAIEYTPRPAPRAPRQRAERGAADTSCRPTSKSWTPSPRPGGTRGCCQVSPRPPPPRHPRRTPAALSPAAAAAAAAAAGGGGRRARCALRGRGARRGHRGHDAGRRAPGRQGGDSPRLQGQPRRPASRRWAPLGAAGRRWLTAAGGARRAQVLQAAWPTTPLRAGATALIFLSFYVRPRAPPPPRRPRAPPPRRPAALGGSGARRDLHLHGLVNFASKVNFAAKWGVCSPKVGGHGALTRRGRALWRQVLTPPGVLFGLFDIYLVSPVDKVRPEAGPRDSCSRGGPALSGAGRAAVPRDQVEGHGLCDRAQARGWELRDGV